MSDTNAAEALRITRAIWSKTNDEMCQTLGRALGYPSFKDDQKNFPDATEADGVCVGDHVAESLAAEAAKTIESLQADNANQQHDITRLYDSLQGEVAENARLTSEVARLREALDLHGAHDIECAGLRDGSCDCGYTAALAKP